VTLARCEVQGCIARVEVRLTHSATQTGVEERHYCAGHAEEVLAEVAGKFARDRRAVRPSTDRCEVRIELVVCDSREARPSQVVLREVRGARRLGFRIGRFESWLLAWELKREEAPALSTHRAMASALRALGGDLTKVTINDVSEGETYRAQVDILQGRSSVVVEMRPSDALPLAVVCDVPIYVEPSVWQKTLRYEKI